MLSIRLFRKAVVTGAEDFIPAFGVPQAQRRQVAEKILTHVKVHRVGLEIIFLAVGVA